MKVSLIRRPARQTLFLLEVENNTNISLATSAFARSKQLTITGKPH
jgi:hypothetical protein